jgi:hypothetical protein
MNDGGSSSCSIEWAPTGFCADADATPTVAVRVAVAASTARARNVPTPK